MLYFRCITGIYTSFLNFPATVVGKQFFVKKKIIKE